MEKGHLGIFLGTADIQNSQHCHMKHCSLASSPLKIYFLPGISPWNISLEYMSLTALWRTQELDEIHFSLCSGTSVPAPPALLLCLRPGSYTHTGEITHTDQVLMPVCSEVMSRSAPAGKENGNDMEDFFFLYCPVSALKEPTQHHHHTPSCQERIS